MNTHVCVYCGLPKNGNFMAKLPRTEKIQETWRIILGDVYAKNSQNIQDPMICASHLTQVFIQNYTIIKSGMYPEPLPFRNIDVVRLETREKAIAIHQNRPDPVVTIRSSWDTSKKRYRFPTTFSYSPQNTQENVESEEVIETGNLEESIESIDNKKRAFQLENEKDCPIKKVKLEESKNPVKEEDIPVKYYYTRIPQKLTFQVGRNNSLPKIVISEGSIKSPEVIEPFPQKIPNVRLMKSMNYLPEIVKSEESNNIPIEPSEIIDPEEPIYKCSYCCKKEEFIENMLKIPEDAEIWKEHLGEQYTKNLQNPDFAPYLICKLHFRRDDRGKIAYGEIPCPYMRSRVHQPVYRDNESVMIWEPGMLEPIRSPKATCDFCGKCRNLGEMRKTPESKATLLEMAEIAPTSKFLRNVEKSGKMSFICAEHLGIENFEENRSYSISENEEEQIIIEPEIIAVKKEEEEEEEIVDVKPEVFEVQFLPNEEKAEILEDGEVTEDFFCMKEKVKSKKTISRRICAYCHVHCLISEMMMVPFSPLILEKWGPIFGEEFVENIQYPARSFICLAHFDNLYDEKRKKRRSILDFIPVANGVNRKAEKEYEQILNDRKMTNRICSYCGSRLPQNQMTSVPRNEQGIREWEWILGAQLRPTSCICLTHFDNLKPNGQRQRNSLPIP